MSAVRELGRPVRLVGGRRPKRILLSVEHCVGLAGEGVFVTGWILDPRAKVESLQVELVGLGITGPLSADLPRPDVIQTVAERELGRARRRLPGEATPGFWGFLPTDASPELVRLIADLGSGRTHDALFAVSEEVQPILSFVQACGLHSVAPYLPRDPRSLPSAWREALLRMLWLLPDDSLDAARLDAYLERGDALPHAARPRPAAPPERRFPSEKLKLLLVGHDARPDAAQALLRDIGQTVRNQFGCEVAYLLVDGEEPLGRVRERRDEGYELAIAGPAVERELVEQLEQAGFRVLRLDAAGEPGPSGFDAYCFELLRLLQPELKKASVVVPNYNYEQHLAGRLESIFDQSAPVFETIVLDDCSSDESLRELERIEAAGNRSFEIVANEANSGSAFRQWAKGCELARGDFLWIAEADDLSRPDFLKRVLGAISDPEFAFGFSDSAQVDVLGGQLGDSYKRYYRLAVGRLMDRDFALDGEAFVRKCLVERNLVLNASSVVWRRAALQDVLTGRLGELEGYRLTGDWYLYAAAALRAGKVAYVAEPLNVHRRHMASVTDSLDKRQHLEEVQRVHAAIAEWLGADTGTRSRMKAYELHLEREFGLR